MSRAICWDLVASLINIVLVWPRQDQSECPGESEIKTYNYFIRYTVLIQTIKLTYYSLNKIIFLVTKISKTFHFQLYFHTMVTISATQIYMQTCNSMDIWILKGCFTSKLWISVSKFPNIHRLVNCFILQFNNMLKMDYRKIRKGKIYIFQWGIIQNSI